MGREIRHVPKNWEHPKTWDGHFKPLCDDYIGTLEYYKKDVDEFIFHMTEIIQKGKVKIYDRVFEDVKELYEYKCEDGQMNPPDINDYMPSGDWFQLFENVSEGTPLSPPFETKEGLVKWLINNPDYIGHQWTKEQAEGIVKYGYSPSMVIMDRKLYTSEEAAELQNK